MRKIKYIRSISLVLQCSLLFQACSAPNINGTTIGKDEPDCGRAHLQDNAWACTTMVMDDDGEISIAPRSPQINPETQITPHEKEPDEQESGKSKSGSTDNGSDNSSGEGDSSNDSGDQVGTSEGSGSGSGGGGGLFPALGRAMSDLGNGIVSTLGGLLGLEKKKKKKKDEIRRKAEEAKSLVEQIEALVESTRQNYLEDLEPLEDLKSDKNFTPGDLRRRANESATKHNDGVKDTFHQDPDLNGKTGNSDLPTTDPGLDDCILSGKCVDTPEKRNVRETRTYIRGARDYVQRNFEGPEKKLRDELLDTADSATSAAENFYNDGNTELGDDTIAVARKIADFVVGATPIVGEIVDIGSAIAGENLITGEKLSDEEAIAQAAMAITSLATGGIVGNIRDVAKGSKILREAVKEEVKREVKKETSSKVGEEVREQIERRTKQVDSGSERSSKYPKDWVRKEGLPYKESHYENERDARSFARTKVGSDPVQVEPGKYRSQDGKWQYRAKPGDLKGHDASDTPHIHLERIDPKTGEVLENIHLRW